MYIYIYFYLKKKIIFIKKKKKKKKKKVNTFVPSNVIQPIKKCIHLKKMVKLKALKHKLNNVKKIIICEDCEVT